MSSGPSLADLERRFRQELERGRQAEVYLLLGPSRRGLRRASDHFAAAFLQAPPARIHEHPECVVLDPDALGCRGLKVEHIATRKEGVLNLEHALRYRPTGIGRRAVLILEADRMNPDAQAALLKTSEEPPAGTLLLLTAKDLSPLLPALRSRCRTYRVGHAEGEDLKAAAAQAGLEPQQASSLSRAFGSLEAALELPPEEIQWLLERQPAFLAWLHGEGPLEAWLEAPSGGPLAEQRRRQQIFLAACLGWLVAEYPQADPGQALFLDRCARHTSQALAYLSGQITPAVVVETLAQSLDGLRRKMAQ
ncbi:MAG: hypothetical protein DWQ01_12725 [Planctomycetota bacterium]|nr:MAG: hypothetical protein DWQ01_12725 [Planctomycetota bacterium]